MLTIIVLAIVGAIMAAVIGTLWYSNATPMGKIHMRSLGFDTLSEEERKNKMLEAKPRMAKMYAAQMVLSFLTSFAVVYIVALSLHNGLSLGMALEFVLVNWLCFMVPLIGSGILWSNCNRSIAWKKFFSDAFENLVVVVLIALMTSIFV